MANVVTQYNQKIKSLSKTLERKKKNLVILENRQLIEISEERKFKMLKSANKMRVAISKIKSYLNKQIWLKSKFQKAMFNKRFIENNGEEAFKIYQKKEL